MRCGQIQTWATIVAIGALSLSAQVAHATPTPYVFQVSSVNPQGFVPTATITIDGMFADLPTITNENQRSPIPGPFTFRNLLGLSFEYPNPGISLLPTEHFSLSDFAEAERHHLRPARRVCGAR